MYEWMDSWVAGCSDVIMYVRVCSAGRTRARACVYVTVERVCVVGVHYLHKRHGVQQRSTQ